MNYKFYTLSSDAWDDMLAAIAGAQKSIYWESYILQDDTPTHNFFDLLKEKARQGIKVKIIIDAFGSFWLSSKFNSELEAAGAEILFFNHLLPWWSARGRVQRFRHWWLNRNHRKILIVDEQIGFLGGVNVAKRFQHWIDLHVQLKGTIVRALLRSFARSYKICGGRDKDILRILHGNWILLRNRKLKIIDHWPSQKKLSLRKYYLQHLNNARQSIVIATPYFFPHWWLIKALKRAAMRHVEIEIILPEKADNFLIAWANHIFSRLVKEKELKINFYFTKDMIHSKTLLVDGFEGLVGSNNIDAQSFDFNAESGLIIKHKQMLADLKNIVNQWKKDARKMGTDYKSGFWHKVLEKIFAILQPIL